MEKKVLFKCPDISLENNQINWLIIDAKKIMIDSLGGGLINSILMV